MSEEDTALQRQIEQLQRSVGRLEECVVALLEETQRALGGAATALRRGQAIGGRQPDPGRHLRGSQQRLDALHKKLTAIEEAVRPERDPTLPPLATVAGEIAALTPEEIQRIADESQALSTAFEERTASMEVLSPFERRPK